MSLAFAAIHLRQFGTAGALFILFWGAMVTAIRLWTDSLTPGLLVHFFNNAAAYILIPLLMSERPRHSPRPGVQSHGFRLDRYAAGLDLMSDIPSDKPMSNLETCPRCGGTGVDPDPDGGDRQSPTADGLVGTLVALFLDWITRKTLALFFPKFHARCRYCRGAGRVPKTPLS